MPGKAGRRDQGAVSGPGAIGEGHQPLAVLLDSPFDRDAEADNAFEIIGVSEGLDVGEHLLVVRIVRKNRRHREAVESRHRLRRIGVDAVVDRAAGILLVPDAADVRVPLDLVKGDAVAPERAGDRKAAGSGPDQAHAKASVHLPAVVLRTGQTGPAWVSFASQLSSAMRSL